MAIGARMAAGLAAVGLAACTLSGCGGGSSASAGRQLAAAGPALSRTQPQVIKRPAPEGPPPALRKLRRAVDGAFRPVAGPGAVIYDLTSRQTLLELRAGVARAPASVEKLYTSAAALDRLGPAARLTTTVLGVGHLGSHGVWHGDLYLRGGGDPTFGDGTFNRAWNDGSGPTASELVRQLASRG